MADNVPNAPQNPSDPHQIPMPGLTPKPIAPQGTPVPLSAANLTQGMPQAAPPVVAPAPQAVPAPVATAPQMPAAQPVAAPPMSSAQPPLTPRQVAPAAVPATPGQPLPPKTPEQMLAEKKALKEQQKKKKLLYILLGAIFFVFFAVFMVAFVMLSQAGSGPNPLLQLFGLSEQQLYPFLITMANLFFGLFVFIAFLISVIGAFMTAMAKKEDKPAKRKGLTMLIVGLIFFVLFSITWAGSYFYLQKKKAQYATNGETVDSIVTIPEETNGLTAPATIRFDASKLPIDTRLYTVISYKWDFGDDATATGPTVSHRYTSKGENDGRYIVQLVILYRENKTSEEAQDTFTVDVVFVNEKVNASFVADATTGKIPFTVNFDATESVDPDGEIVSYEWDLDGDGEYGDSEELTPSYTYTKFGTYTVKLRVTDNNGESNVMEMEIVASETAQASATIEVITEEGDVFYVGKSYLFDAKNATSPNGTVEKYEWNFGDGTPTVKTKTAQHTYSEAGDYTLTLTLTDEEGEKGEVTRAVEVTNPESMPVAVITTDQPWADEEQTTISGNVPYKIQFSATESTDKDENIVSYSWDINNDGTVDGVGETFTYSYEAAGNYTAQLFVEDAEGNESQSQIKVNVEEQGIHADIQVNTVSGEVPFTVSLDASGSTYPSGKIVNYLWDFGNGVTRYDGAQVTYTFTEVGVFPVTVTAIGSDESEDEASVSINAMPVALSACFTANVDSGKAPLIVTFNPSCSSGTVNSYHWEFGNGDISYARKPTYTYEEPGTYVVKLTVKDNEGFTDSYTVTIGVYGSN